MEKWAAADDLRSIDGQIEFLLRQAVTRRKNTVRRDSAVSPTQGATKVPLMT
jgi:hypothetical protein